MDNNKLTQKSIEAINNANSMAIKDANPEVNEFHLAYSLVDSPSSYVSMVLGKMGVDVNNYKKKIEDKIESLPKQSGNAKTYPSQVFQRIFLKAEDEADAMGDSFISIEHIFLSLLKERTEMTQINKEFNITYKDFKNHVLKVRNGQKVTSDNPEETSNPLEKYGRDLTDEAREGKIDPVIGRDAEIRNALRILSRRKKKQPSINRSTRCW